MYIARVLTSWRKSNREGIEEKKKNRRRGDISGLFFLNTQQTHDKWWGFWGARRKKNRTRLFKDQEGSFNYTVVALQFVTCDNKKGRNHDKKNARNEIKGKNQSFPFSNTISSPIDDPSILSAPPYFDTAFARSHPIATLKITWVIFCFLLCVIWRFMITIRRRNIQFIPSCFFFVPKR